MTETRINRVQACGGILVCVSVCLWQEVGNKSGWKRTLYWEIRDKGRYKR